MKVIVFVSHEVKEFAAWKKGFDANQTVRDAAGFKQAFLARDAKKPNLVHVGFFAPSVDAAQNFVGDPKLKETMEKSGVIGMPDIRIANVA